MENLINKLAHKFNKKTGIDFQELKSEAYLAYCEALLSFNPDKGTKQSTHVYACVNNALIDFCKVERGFAINGYYVPKERVYDSVGGRADQLPEIPIETREPWEEMEDKFSEIGKKVIEIVFKNDCFEGSPKAMRGQVIEILREENWSWPMIWKGMKEVKMVLN